MAFPKSDRNTKMNPGAVVPALQRLTEPGAPGSIVGNKIPSSSLSGHVQGVAIRGSHAVITTSADKGYILTGTGDGRDFEVDVRRTVQTFNHPGGVQTIGDWLVAPVEYRPGGKKNSEIRFYRYKNGLQRADHLTVVRDEKKLGKAGSVGIANYTITDGERYLLATCPDRRRVHFYQTEPGVPLSLADCSFGDMPVVRWRADSVPKKDRMGWRPNSKWRNYVNSIALLADTSGNVYFLGMCQPRWPLGPHIADLFAVDLRTPKQPKTVFTKLARVKVDPNNGTGFRWGAGALVVGPKKLRLFACERDVMLNPRRVRLNIFHGKNDPL